MHTKRVVEFLAKSWYLGVAWTSK